MCGKRKEERKKEESKEGKKKLYTDVVLDTRKMKKDDEEGMSCVIAMQVNARACNHYFLSELCMLCYEKLSASNH